MKRTTIPSDRRISRRGFLGLAGAVASMPLLGACNIAGNSGAGGAAGGVITFWDMPWGPTAYSDTGARIVDAYTPQNGLPDATYQVIQWNNYYQTFASAIASDTGPAVGTGAAFQAFQFAEQGAVTYADRFIESLRADGTYDDFLPRVFDAMHTPRGYVGVPWQLDVNALWYNRALLEEAGAGVPTDWDSLLRAGLALRQIGASGFGIGAGPDNNQGAHTMMSLMINNGGGLFDEDGNPDCVIDRNIEAMDFVRELVGQGVIDPGAVSYTSDNLSTQWNERRAGIGFYDPALEAEAPSVAADLVVAPPITGPHGDKGVVYFVNNIVMYANTPSQEGSEAFLRYYLSEMKAYWQQGLVGGVPALRSIAQLPEFRADPNQVTIVEQWQPVAKTYAARGTEPFAAIAAVDGGQAMTQFIQTMLQGGTDSRTALTTLQQGIEAVVQ